MTKGNLVSVIIPVFNTEEYVARCLDSLIGQTHDNLEIIVIVDASPDRSVDIVKKYIKNDSRIKLIQLNENIGSFHARIKGMHKMRGQYFTMIDSDDYVDTNFIKSLLDEALKNNAEITLSDGYISVDEYGNKHKMTFPDLIKSPHPFQNFMSGVASQKYGWGVLGKLYKYSLFEQSKAFFNHINEKIIMGDDIIYMTFFTFFAKKVSRVNDEHGYNYYQNPDSVTNNQNTSESYKRYICDIFQVMVEIERFLVRNDLEKKYRKELLEFRRWQIGYLTDDIYLHNSREIDLKNTEIRAKNHEIEQLKDEKQKIVNSKTYKLGSAITAPVRLLRSITKK